MNKYYYKHLSHCERRKLESLISNEPALNTIFGPTDYGWDIVSWECLANINQIVFVLRQNW